MDLAIRPASELDLDLIIEYNARLAEETEGKTVDRDLLRSGVATLLADSTKGSYFLAEAEGKVIGQIMITFEWSDWRNGVFWWIQSVYVHSAFRQKGVFSRLFRHVESQARAVDNVCGLRLYVDKDNEQASAVYRKLGLDATRYEVMEQYFADGQ